MTSNVEPVRLPWHRYAKKCEAAAFLEIPERTLYLGRLGTAHLRRIKRGSQLRWFWPQLERHNEVEILEGVCTGKCLSVFENLQRNIESTNANEREATEGISKFGGQRRR